MCSESSLSASNTSHTQADSDHGPSPDQAEVISSLKVFKLQETSSGPKTGGKKRLLLASLTSDQSRLTRVSNGVLVDGVLEAGTATLRLELVKAEDCLAEFVCEARGVDNEGKKFVSTSHILQQAEESNDMRSKFIWASPGPAMQVLSLIQQLDSKLAVVGNAVDSWNDEMRRMKDSFQHNVESLRNDLNTTTYRMDAKIQALGENVASQTDRLEDKIEFLFRDLNNNTSQSEGTGVTRQSDSSQNVDIDAIQRQINSGFFSLDLNISSIKDGLSQVGTEMQKNFKKVNLQLEALERNDQQFFNNLTKSSESAVCDGNGSFTGVVKGGFDSLGTSIQKKFDEIFLNMNDTTWKPRSCLGAKSSQENHTLDTKLRSVLKELLTPNICYKGMASAVFLASSKYSIIQPSENNSLPAQVLCDTFTDGGGWIVLQRRVTGDVNFYRGWEDYKQGFGSLDGEFWLGNDNIHAITSRGVFEVRVDLRYNDKSVFAHYDAFSVGDESSKYVLRVAHYSGTAGDSLLRDHDGRSFTTYDRDNDMWYKNCAESYLGAWWYKGCHDSNLNGLWGKSDGSGLMWRPLTGDNSVSFSEMKIRRVF